MAEEHSGEGEFKGSGDFAARLADVVAALDRIELGQKSLRMEFLGELGKTRADVMGKIAELKGEVTAIRDDLAVTFGASDSVRRAHNNTRDEMRDLGESVSALYRKLARLETQVRELKGDP